MNQVECLISQLGSAGLDVEDFLSRAVDDLEKVRRLGLSDVIKKLRPYRPRVYLDSPSQLRIKVFTPRALPYYPCSDKEDEQVEAILNQLPSTVPQDVCSSGDPSLIITQNYHKDFVIDASPKIITLLFRG